MNTELAIDREQMYRLVQIDDGRCVLAVICGGAAMYERSVVLTQEEVNRWKQDGHEFLLSFARNIAKNEQAFAERFYQDILP